MPFDPFPENCQRCGAKLASSTMSRFDTAMICSLCDDDERLAPGYAAARESEEAAVVGGNLNYPGVGLSAADRAVLAERRAARGPR